MGVRNQQNTKIIQKQYTIKGTGISYYYIAPPQDNMKCISVSNANWSSCNVLVKGISMSGASAIIFTEVISRHQKNLQSIPFGWKVSIIF